LRSKTPPGAILGLLRDLKQRLCMAICYYANLGIAATMADRGREYGGQIVVEMAPAAKRCRRQLHHTRGPENSVAEIGAARSDRSPHPGTSVSVFPARLSFPGAVRWRSRKCSEKKFPN